MNDHFISDGLYKELSNLPDKQLLDTAAYLRKQWVRDPNDGESYIGFIICCEVLEARKLALPPYPNERAMARALKAIANKLKRD